MKIQKIRYNIYNWLLKIIEKVKPKYSQFYNDGAEKYYQSIGGKVECDLSTDLRGRESIGTILDKAREDGYRKIENYQSTFTPLKTKLSKKQLKENILN